MTGPLHDLQRSLGSLATQTKPNPYRSEQVAVRIARRRRSRITLTAATAALCAATAISAVMLRPDADAPPATPEPSPTYVLPERIETAAGTYVRLTSNTITYPEQNRLAFFLTYTGRPLFWLAHCSGAPGSSGVAAKAGDSYALGLWPGEYTPCGANEQTPRRLIIPPVQQPGPLSVGFFTSNGQSLEEITTPYAPSGKPTDGPATWTVGFYEWRQTG